jgi:hypothetical protein
MQPPRFHFGEVRQQRCEQAIGLPHQPANAPKQAFGDQTGSKPFWTELEVLSGVRNGNGTSGGAWSCASLELFEPGFPDTEGVATGTWLLVPVN